MAVRFPWGRLGDLLAAGEGPSIREAVIFATDSRFTSPDNQVLQDDGQKLYRVAGDAAIAYSGDVLAAQRAVREVRKYFSRRRRDAAQEATQTVSRILRAAYELEQVLARQKNRKFWPLHILAGWRSQDGQASVALFESPKFSPQPADIGLVGGSKGERKIFAAKLKQFEEERWARGALPLDPKPWQIDVSGSLWSVIEAPDASRSIGGKVQTIAITADGFIEQEVSFTTGDPLKLTSWTVVTMPMSEVRPYQIEAKRHVSYGIPLLAEHDKPIVSATRRS